jgi:hypothetical protein
MGDFCKFLSQIPLFLGGKKGFKFGENFVAFSHIFLAFWDFSTSFLQFGQSFFANVLLINAEKQKKSSFSKCFQKIVIVAKTNHWGEVRTQDHP